MFYLHFRYPVQYVCICAHVVLSQVFPHAMLVNTIYPVGIESTVLVYCR